MSVVYPRKLDGLSRVVEQGLRKDAVAEGTLMEFSNSARQFKLEGPIFWRFPDGGRIEDMQI